MNCRRAYLAACAAVGIDPKEVVRTGCYSNKGGITRMPLAVSARLVFSALVLGKVKLVEEQAWASGRSHGHSSTHRRRTVVARLMRTNGTIATADGPRRFMEVVEEAGRSMRVRGPNVWEQEAWEN